VEMLVAQEKWLEMNKGNSPKYIATTVNRNVL
jgi:hypothetical protein